MLKTLKILFMKKLYSIGRKYSFKIRSKNLYYEIKTSKNYICLASTMLKFHYITSFSTLIDIAVVDTPKKKKRFSFVYNFLSLKHNIRLFLKFKVTEIAKILSISSIFSCSNWIERESWDMFGTFFLKHPDLRRILNDYNFQGFPLKKDFPLSGFKEVIYNTTENRLIYKKVKLDQEYRHFNYNPILINHNKALSNIVLIGSQWNYIESISGVTPDPDNIKFLCGILIALIIQIFVNYDYFSLYAECSTYFTRSHYKDIRRIVKKFNLKERRMSFVEKAWPFSIKFLCIEVILCILLRYQFSYSYLAISLVIWTFSFFLSVFAVTFISYYLNANEDIKIALYLRDERIVRVKKKLQENVHEIRIQALKLVKPGGLLSIENAVNAEMSRRLQQEKNQIALELFNRESDEEIQQVVELNKLNTESEESDETKIREWLISPAKYQLFNIFFYLYYLFALCAKDSIYLREKLISFSSDKSKIKGITFSDNIHYSDNYLEILPLLEKVRDFGWF
jgi:NADH-quinone oxidoreductase subunit C